MKTRIVLITIVIGLYSTGSWATVVDNATMREIPPSGSKGMSQPELVKHPEYKKLLDDLKRFQAKLKTTDDITALTKQSNFHPAA